MPTTKQAGLGDNFYVAGYDLSGDVASVDTLSGASDVLDVTSIKESAYERRLGQRAGLMSFTTYFENNIGVSNPAVPGSTVPYVSTYNFSVLVTVIGGTGTQVSINGVNQGSFDGTYVLPPLGTIILTYSVVPTWSWTAVGGEHNLLHTLPTSDIIGTYFHATTIGNPACSCNGKQLNYDPTRDASGNLTLQVSIQGNLYGLEWGYMLTPGLRTDLVATTGAFFDQGTPTTTAFGAQAYLQLVDFVGTSVDVQIQHATTSGGSYTTLIDFGAQTAIGGYRQTVSNVTNVNEFLKVVTVGTFTMATFAVMINRNLIAGVTF
jgi:hypothetical protein